jgi:hypothetical protein
VQENIFRKSYRVCGRLEESGTTGQATHDNLRIAYWIPKGTSTHSEYVMLVAFPMQQWLRERASVLRYTYIASLLIFKKNPHCLLCVSSFQYVFHHSDYFPERINRFSSLLTEKQWLEILYIMCKLKSNNAIISTT